MQHSKKTKGVWVAICCGLLLGIVLVLNGTMAYAQDYVPLVGLPGLEEKGATGIPDYINNVYKMLIAIGALLAVLRIAWAGVKYSLSEMVTEKESARHEIRGVLVGLAVLLIPFIVLFEINPDLVNLNVLQEAEKNPLELKGRTVADSNQTNYGPHNIPEGTSIRSCEFDKNKNALGWETDGWDGGKCREACAADGGFIIEEVRRPVSGATRNTPDYLRCGFPPDTERPTDTTTVRGGMCRPGETKEQCQRHCNGTVEEQTNVGGTGLVCVPRDRQLVQMRCTIEASDPGACERECRESNGTITSSTATETICEYQ